ncbi:hypothetical protein IAT38_002404 [Cryptococcus sp. DSM 104549]
MATVMTPQEIFEHADSMCQRGDAIGPWRFEEVLGCVVGAINIKTGEPAAIKVMAHGPETPDSTPPHMAEALLLTMLGKHPNTGRLLEVYDQDDYFYLVTEYYPSGDVMAFLSKSANPAKDMPDILFGIAQALRFLHARRIAHLDIKADNVLIGGDGQARLVDYGMAWWGGEETMARCGARGTPCYVAPEAIKNDGTFDGFKADVWSLGMLLRQMEKRSLPLDVAGDSLQDTLWRVLYEPLDNSGKFEGDLQSLLEGMLQRDPAKRFSIEDVLAHPMLASKAQIEPFRGLTVEEVPAFGPEHEVNQGLVEQLVCLAGREKAGMSEEIFLDALMSKRPNQYRLAYYTANRWFAELAEGPAAEPVMPNAMAPVHIGADRTSRASSESDAAFSTFSEGSSLGELVTTRRVQVERAHAEDHSAAPLPTVPHSPSHAFSELSSVELSISSVDDRLEAAVVICQRQAPFGPLPAPETTLHSARASTKGDSALRPTSPSVSPCASTISSGGSSLQDVSIELANHHAPVHPIQGAIITRPRISIHKGIQLPLLPTPPSTAHSPTTPGIATLPLSPTPTPELNLKSFAYPPTRLSQPHTQLAPEPASTPQTPCLSKVLPVPGHTGECPHRLVTQRISESKRVRMRVPAEEVDKGVRCDMIRERGSERE